MVREIVHDPMFLSLVSEKAKPEDVGVAEDLIQTLYANRNGCVGMAANMIGILKRIIVFTQRDKIHVMFNPVIVRKSGTYETEEGCLSLSGVRKTKRYKNIEVKYQTEKFKTVTEKFEGWTAQIIQHEIDHCNGVLI